MLKTHELETQKIREFEIEKLLKLQVRNEELENALTETSQELFATIKHHQLVEN